MSSEPMSIQQIVRRDDSDLALTPIFNVEKAIQKIEELQKFVKFYLKEGEDFGTIPGTPKPTLYKPGADKLCDIYALADSYRVTNRIEEWDKNLFDYEIECTLSSKRNGGLVSTGVGSCNSWEGRYRWRELKRVCPNCNKPTIIKGKAQFGGGWICWQKEGKSDGCGAKFAETDEAITSQVVGRTENEDIPTLKNTLLKMAKKRAKVDAVLSATRSSGLFTQDIEDWTNIQDEGSIQAAQAVAAQKIADLKSKQSPTQNQTEAGKSAPVAQQPPNKSVEKVRGASTEDRWVYFSYPWEHTGDLCLSGPGCKLMIDYLIFTAEGVLDTETEEWRITGSTKIIALFDKFRELNIVYKELEPVKAAQEGRDGGATSRTTDLPVITKAEMGKGKASKCLFVELSNGEKASCWDTKLFQYLKPGKTADLKFDSNGKFVNIRGIKRIDNVEFDENNLPIIQQELR